MKHYQSDEFFNSTIHNNTHDAIDKKVSLLYDLCILVNRHDEREQAVRELLCSYGSEERMTNALHDVILGNKSLNTLLKGGEK